MVVLWGMNLVGVLGDISVDNDCVVGALDCSVFSGFLSFGVFVLFEMCFVIS